jgi:membrane fusion protein, heavy metal efflux system
MSVLIRVALFALCIAQSLPAVAHEGHDHAEEAQPAPAAAAGAARRVVVMSSEIYEAVIEPHGDHFAIWLDRHDTNEPVTGAKIEVTLDELAPLQAREAEPGVYDVDLPEGFDTTQAVNFQLVIAAEPGDDLLGGTLDAATAAEHAHSHWYAGTRGLLLAGGIAVVLALLASLALRSRRGRGTALASVAPMALTLGFAAVVLLGGGASRAIAHEGHDHGEEEAAAPAMAAATGLRPMRAADGSVYLPKPTQRILAVRTLVAAEGPAPISIKLIGEIIGDPRASASLQTLQGGRVAAGPRGWPELGARVQRGQPLLTLTPSGSASERAGASVETARAEAELTLARLELERLEGLTGIVARAEVEAARARVTSLAAQRMAWRGTAGGGELITAPIGGVIAALNVRPGEVVQPGVDLVTIIDPARLGVDALAFTPIDSSAVSRATVSLRDGTTLQATLAGVGATQTGGALPVRLQLASAAPGITVGQPVTAWLEQTVTTPGFVLPAAALVRLTNGETVVFEKRAAEVFVPRTVRTRVISGDRIAVLAGIEPGARIVVQGAGLIAQVR